VGNTGAGTQTHRRQYLFKVASKNHIGLEWPIEIVGKYCYTNKNIR
jgi:hypothetical protein